MAFRALGDNRRAAVSLVAASYLGCAFPLNGAETFVIAFGIILAAFIFNYRGITISNKVQIATVISIIALLLAAVVFSAHSVKASNFSPFLP